MFCYYCNITKVMYNDIIYFKFNLRLDNDNIELIYF